MLVKIYYIISSMKFHMIILNKLETAYIVF